MRIGDEEALATMVRGARHRRGLSQPELSETARVSTKTVQRMEAGRSIAGSSRRAVLNALGIDPDDVETSKTAQPEAAERPWAQVQDARTLLRRVVAAKNVDIDLDREGWRQARRDRPWHKQDLVFATKDPVDMILEIVDQATQKTEMSPGQAAKQQDELAGAMRAAAAMSWSLASRVDAAGCLSLYIGAPSVVQQKVGC